MRIVAGFEMDARRRHTIPAGRAYNQQLTLAEFLDNVATHEAVGSGICTGPRVQGNSDKGWEDDNAIFANADRCLEATSDAVLPNTPLMVALAASAEDPTIVFKEDPEALASAWFTGPLKIDYQAARVPGKRAWPEFAASIKSSSGLTHPDVCTLALIARLDLATLEGGKLIISPRHLDKPFTTLVMDARAARETAMGLLVRDAVQALPARAPLKQVAQALALSDGPGRCGVLAARIASRQAALHAFLASQE
jgi:hypothetical protein